MSDDLKNLIPKAVPLNGTQQNISIDCEWIFPKIDGQTIPFCPIVEPTMIQLSKPPQIKYARLYHPCLKECRLWDSIKQDCKLSQR